MRKRIDIICAEGKDVIWSKPTSSNLHHAPLGQRVHLELCSELMRRGCAEGRDRGVLDGWGKRVAAHERSNLLKNTFGYSIIPLFDYFFTLPLAR